MLQRAGDAAAHVGRGAARALPGRPPLERDNEAATATLAGHALAVHARVSLFSTIQAEPQHGTPEIMPAQSQKSPSPQHARAGTRQRAGRGSAGPPGRTGAARLTRSSQGTASPGGPVRRGRTSAAGRGSCFRDSERCKPCLMRPCLMRPCLMRPCLMLHWVGVRAVGGGEGSHVEPGAVRFHDGGEGRVRLVHDLMWGPGSRR